MLIKGVAFIRGHDVIYITDIKIYLNNVLYRASCDVSGDKYTQYYDVILLTCNIIAIIAQLKISVKNRRFLLTWFGWMFSHVYIIMVKRWMPKIKNDTRYRCEVLGGKLGQPESRCILVYPLESIYDPCE